MKLVRRPSPNFAPRPTGQQVDMLVVHYTGMQSAEAALDRLCDPVAEVSAHYLIDEDGVVVELVAEEMRAWHAGRSFWRGHSDINSRSIGIELVNPGYEFGYRPFREAQIVSLIALCQQILPRWPIPPRNVVGHSDVAPSRKQDPGELFPWQRLAELGVGLWPQPLVARQDVAAMLRDYGYGWQQVDELAAVVTAFQRHFRPKLCDGRIDAEITALLAGLIALL